jgi:hypothetical protein
MRIFTGLDDDNPINYSDIEWVTIPKSKYNCITLLLAKVDGATIVDIDKKTYFFKKGAILTTNKVENYPGFFDFDENDLIDLPKWPRI